MGNGVLAEDTGENRCPLRRAASTSQGIAKRRRIGTDSNQSNRRARSCGAGHDASRTRIHECARNIRSAWAASHIGQVEYSVRRKRKGIRAVFAEGTATLSKRGQIIARRGITGIQLVGGQQTMSLRADVGNLQENVARQFALDGQVVLIGILRAHICGKLAEIDAGEEPGPVNRLAPRWIQDSREGVRSNRAILADVGSLKKRTGDEIAPAERRFGAELLEYELLDGVIKHSVSRADAGLARSAGQFSKPSVMRAGSPVQPQARSESLVVGICQTIRNRFVAGKNESDGRDSRGIAAGLAGAKAGKERIAGIEAAWVNGRALSGPEGLHLVPNVCLRRVQFPTHAIIQRQIRLDLPAVLRKEIHRLASYQFMLSRALGHIACQSKEIVGVG